MPEDVYIQLENPSVSDLIRYLQATDYQARPVLIDGSEVIHISISDPGNCTLEEAPLNIKAIKIK